MQTFGRRPGVRFPSFDGSENEDVFEFLDKFKRAATLNDWNDDDLPINWSSVVFERTCQCMV